MREGLFITINVKGSAFAESRMEEYSRLQRPSLIILTWSDISNIRIDHAIETHFRCII